MPASQPEIVKTYPPRGPLRQVRLAERHTLTCFRCGDEKTSKLHALYEDDWDRRLCNGCYGYLLSIYEVKAGTDPEDERVDKLAALLLKLAEGELRHAAVCTTDGLRLILSAEAETLISTSEAVASYLASQENLEWSPAVIGLCKAVELEVVRLVLMPWREACVDLDLALDMKDEHIGRVARWCSGRTDTPPELGTLVYTLRTIARSERHAASALAGGLRQAVKPCSEGEWITRDDGLLFELEVLSREHRNRAAHADALDQANYTRCRDAVLGPHGTLAHLVAATAR